MLKELFLKYVELQNCAEASRFAHGAFDSKTVTAFDKANEAKRALLTLMEEHDSHERRR